MKETEENLRYRATKAAWMSFVGGYKQADIAKELDTSQSKIHRLIAHAQANGYVSIRINGGSAELLELERQLKSAFQLDRCTVASAGIPSAADEDALMTSVGETAGQYLSFLLDQKSIGQIGAGMGRTMSAAVSAMSEINRPDLNIVAITGSLMRKLSANPLDVVMQMQRKTGGEGYFLPVPYLAHTVEERETYQSHQSVQDLIALAHQSDIFAVGIGSVTDDSNLAQTQTISSAELKGLREAGVVGDIAGSFFNCHGHFVDVELGRMTVGIRGEKLKGRRVLGIAAGLSKTEAVLGGLRTGVISEIILDELLAAAILKEHSASNVSGGQCA